MVAQITPLPDPPSRSTQSREEFVVATDNWLFAIQTFTLQANSLAVEVYNNTVLTAGYVASALTYANRAEAASAFRVSFAAESWVILSGITGAYANQSAGVYGDAGTHTDPVVGGTKANSGIYRWSVSPAGWKWIDAGTGAAVTWASITGKPSVFTPDAHTHAMSDITGLSTALSGKAATGAVGSSGLTMASGALLGRSTASTGAIETITLGVGLSLVAGVLSYTGSTSMVYPGAGIAVSTGSAWGTSLSVPGGGLVGLTASQTLTNKTFTSPTINGGTDTTAKTGGSLQAAVTVNDTGTIGADSPGFRGTPVVSVTSRTLVATDHGKDILHTGAITIPSGLPVGFRCSLSNNSASTNSVIQGSGVTLRKGNANSTGTQTINAYGEASVSVKSSNVVWVSGAIA